MTWRPTGSQAAWFVDSLHRHARLHFRPEVEAALKALTIHVRPLAAIGDAAAAGLYFANDVPPEFGGEITTIEFAGTTIGLVQLLPKPGRGEWRAISAGGVPVWWVNSAGAATPAWNFFGVCVGLLTGYEEFGAPSDRYGGFSLSASSRLGNGLLERPTVNEIFAAIAAFALARHHGHENCFDLRDLVLPPLLFLSHDCDNLSGRSIWLQLARTRRFFLGSPYGRAFDPRQVAWALNGWVDPKAGFASEVDDFIRLETEEGFWSRFYFLLGPRGRYGARMDVHRTLSVARRIRAPHEVGLHYNLMDNSGRTSLVDQANTLAGVLSGPPRVGRAHYLSFNPQSSPQVWERTGLRLDESFGSADRPIYRLGYAGAFRWFSLLEDRQLQLVECPLQFMDHAIVAQWPEDPVRGLLGWVRHIERLGGAISILFHPGFLANPEFQSHPGLYRGLLEEFRKRHARQIRTDQLLSALGVS